MKKTALFLYIVSLALFFCITGFGLRLSHLIPLLFPLAFIERRPMSFLARWAPFYLIILLYDCFRGIADDLALRVEYLRLINWEKFVFFGNVPTIWIQSRFSDALTGPVGSVLTIFYFGHFVLPLVLLYWTWRKQERAFLCFMSCLCFLSIASFITFFLFPAAPPWLASDRNLLPPVQKIIVGQIEALSAGLPRLYIDMNSNPVAAFPSLHSAYPVLWLLCAWKYLPKKIIPFFLLNVFGVAIAVVSFGEHYVVDVLAGWSYAGISFFVTEEVLLPFLTKRRAFNFDAAGFPHDLRAKTKPQLM